MREIAIVNQPEVLTHPVNKAVLSLDRLIYLTEGNGQQLKELVVGAIVGLEEAKTEVVQACDENNAILFDAAIHKVTPLFYYLEAQPILAIIKSCSHTVLNSNHVTKTNVDCQIILKNLDNVLVELIEQSKAVLGTNSTPVLR